MGIVFSSIIRKLKPVHWLKQGISFVMSGKIILSRFVNSNQLNESVEANVEK